MGLPTVSRVLRYKEPQEDVINVALDALSPEPPVKQTVARNGFPLGWEETVPGTVRFLPLKAPVA